MSRMRMAAVGSIIPNYMAAPQGVGYSDNRFNTSFTGFVETREGPVVGSILLWGANISQNSEYVTGGSTAAPIFKNIISYFLYFDFFNYQ